MTLFKDVFIVSGCGVGGGSLGYANTLYRAGRRSSRTAVGGLADGSASHAPLRHRRTDARRHRHSDRRRPTNCCGARARRRRGHLQAHPGRRLLRRAAGKERRDPFFGGEGPERAGCIRCGSCMVGCRHGAKNTLVKNYLWFAEKLGVEILAERPVTDVGPIGAVDGSEGYAVVHERSGAWMRTRARTLPRAASSSPPARWTPTTAPNCKRRGSARLSERLGHVVRTNSRVDPGRDRARRRPRLRPSIAITSSIYPDPDTHIEVVTYGRAGDRCACFSRC